MDVPSISLSSQKNTKTIKSKSISQTGASEEIKMPQEPIRLMKYLAAELRKHRWS